MSPIVGGLPAIKVMVSMDGSYVVLAPRDPDGDAVFQRIVDGMPDTQRWHYCGSDIVRRNGAEELVGVRYACGGVPRWETVDHITRLVYDGAVVVHLDLTDLQGDERYVLRRYGFFSRVSMEVDSTPQRIRLRAAACKTCNQPLSCPVELAWNTCDACAAVCEHSYHFGVGMARGMVAYLRFCGTCGRVDPSWQPDPDPTVDMLRTVSEGVVDMLMLRHDDGSVTTLTRS